jgi:hypothetical protein
LAIGGGPDSISEDKFVFSLAARLRPPIDRGLGETKMSARFYFRNGDAPFDETAGLLSTNLTPNIREVFRG